MKKIKRILAGVMAVCLMGGVTVIPESIAPAVSMTASAETGVGGYTKGTYELLTYKNYGDHIEISDCEEFATEVIIPSEIEGVPVTSIGEYAFDNCISLTSVNIPDTVTNIERGAFWYCSNLTSINISDSVTSIGYNAFWFCSNLTSIDIPDSVTTIGNLAFCNCSNLTSVTIPDSVTYIGGGAFGATPWIKEKQKENPLVIVNNILIDGQTCEGDIIIPDSVTDIAGGAFAYCENLTSIDIPNGIKSIGEGAFSDSNLQSIEIPDSVISIEEEAFSACQSLKEITILNPECKISDNSSTISNGYKSPEFYFNGTIRGYENSTAQAYAEKYGYNFESIGQAPEKETVLGDVNGDGLIDAVDATSVLIEYSRLSTGGDSTFTEQQKKSADVNGDSLIDAVDATFILSYYAHVSTGGTMKLPEFIGTTGVEN